MTKRKFYRVTLKYTVPAEDFEASSEELEQEAIGLGGDVEISKVEIPDPGW